MPPQIPPLALTQLNVLPHDEGLPCILLTLSPRMCCVACRQHQVQLLHDHFNMQHTAVASDRLIYGNYLVPGAEVKVRHGGSMGAEEAWTAVAVLLLHILQLRQTDLARCLSLMLFGAAGLSTSG